MIPKGVGQKFAAGLILAGLIVLFLKIHNPGDHVMKKHLFQPRAERLESRQLLSTSISASTVSTSLAGPSSSSLTSAYFAQQSIQNLTLPQAEILLQPQAPASIPPGQSVGGGAGGGGGSSLPTAPTPAGGGGGSSW